MSKFCQKYTLLNTVDFIFKVGQLFTHCLGQHSRHMTSKLRRCDVMMSQTSVRGHFDVMHLQGSNVVFVL